MTTLIKDTLVVIRSPHGTKMLDSDPFQPGVQIALASDEELLFIKYEKDGECVTNLTPIHTHYHQMVNVTATALCLSISIIAVVLAVVL